MVHFQLSHETKRGVIHLRVGMKEPDPGRSYKRMFANVIAQAELKEAGVSAETARNALPVVADRYEPHIKADEKGQEHHYTLETAHLPKKLHEGADGRGLQDFLITAVWVLRKDYAHPKDTFHVEP